VVVVTSIYVRTVYEGSKEPVASRAISSVGKSIGPVVRKPVEAIASPDNLIISTPSRHAGHRGKEDS